MDEIVGRGLNVGGVGLLPLPFRKVKMKRIYYHPNGEPTCLLPADTYHERLLLSKGFTLEPPHKDEVKTEVKTEVKELRLPKGQGVCPDCGKKCKGVRLHYKLAHKGR